MAGFGTEINFDINNILDELETDGVFSKAEADKIRKKNLSKSNSTSGGLSGGQAAALGQVGSMISGSAPNDSTAGAIGGAAQGAAMGFKIAGGPWGAAIGGVIGGVQGALGANQARKAQDRKTETERVATIANIQSNATADRNNQINNMISGLSRTLISGR